MTKAPAAQYYPAPVPGPANFPAPAPGRPGSNRPRIFAAVGAAVVVLLVLVGVVTLAGKESGGPESPSYAAISVGRSTEFADPAVDSGTGSIYVSNQDKTVSVIDGRTNRVTATIALAESVTQLAVDPALSRLYAVYPGDQRDNRPGGVIIVDTATNTSVATVQTGKQALSIAVDPVTHLVYVTNLQSFESVHQAPADMANRHSALTVIDPRTASVLESISVGSAAFHTEIDETARTAYVITKYQNPDRMNPETGILVVDLDSRRTIDFIALPAAGNGNDLVLDPVSRTAYAKYDDLIYAVDLARRTVLATIDTDGHGLLTADRATHTAYVTQAEYLDGEILVIDTLNGQSKDSIPAGDSPLFGFAADPVTHTLYLRTAGELVVVPR
ncbi:YncE family protein [Nocardia sp. NPDC057668]|uniref:YncE family protein n=1 Tax=Nocardia sp. NPDC057668 TaxID=3346202 RepID=UPI00366FDE78